MRFEAYSRLCYNTCHMYIPEFWCHHIVKLPAGRPDPFDTVKYDLWETTLDSDGGEHQQRAGSVKLVPAAEPPGETFEAVVEELDQRLEAHNAVDLRKRVKEQLLVRARSALAIYDGAEHLQELIRKEGAKVEQLGKDIADLQPQEQSTDNNLPDFMRRHGDHPRPALSHLVFREQGRPDVGSGNWGLVVDPSGLLDRPVA